MIRLLCLILGFLPASSAWAAGFLDHKSGVPYRWKTFPIVYKVDPGPLALASNPNGAINHADGLVLIEKAFQHWKDIPIATVDFKECSTDPACAPLAEDITAANADAYVFFDSSGAPRSVTPDTIVVFDADGGIIDKFLGVKQSSQVLGLASAGAFNDADMSITSGVAILNGKFGNPTQLEATITHELGHMLNLQHSQLNEQEAFDSNSLNDNVVPTMFPFLPGTGITMLTPKADDAFSLAYLYPNASTYGARGTITGKILRRNGDGVRGVHVICRNVADPRADAVSWVSDQVLAGNGEYVCGNLSNGSYTVFIEPVTLAINVYTPDPPFVVSEHYSGIAESYDPALDVRATVTSDDPSGSTGSETITPVSVTGGSTTAEINIVLNEDGRLISGTPVTATSSAFFPPTEYFITVPPGTDSATFEVTTASKSTDFDLMGRCDSEFSLPIDSIALPLVSATGGAQQADFATSSPGGNETISLSGSSKPALKACTYHILVVNYSATATSSSTDFTLTVTLNGGPELAFSELTRRSSAGDGDTEMLTQRVSAKNESFEIRSLTYSDDGWADFSRVTKARLYLDTDGDQKATSADTVLAESPSLDPSARKITFTGFDLSVDAGASKNLIVVYTFVPAAGGVSWLLIAAFLPLGLIAIRKRSGIVPIVLVAFISILSCAQSLDYDPNLKSDADVVAQGISYGSKFKVNRVPRFTNCTAVAPLLQPTGSGDVSPRCLPN